MRSSTTGGRGWKRGVPLMVPLCLALVAAMTATVTGAPPSAASPPPAPAGAAQPATAGQGAVTVFPQPGTTTLSPRSQLSFRSPGLSSIADLKVVGSKSGAHSGRWLSHSDHGGTSFLPDHAFTPGETVTVTTSRAVTGAAGGRFTYKVAQPAVGARTSAPTLTDPPATSGSHGAAAAPGAVPSALPTLGQPPTPPGPAGPYRSRPDLHPPQINTTVGTGVAPGLLLGTSDIVGNGVQSGTIIYDNTGQPVWFNPTNYPFGLQEITYQGQTALAYFQPLSSPYPGDNVGEGIVLDNAYRQIGTIQAGNGYSMNEHDLQISPDGSKALMTIWAPVQMDLSPYGGPVDGVVLEGIVQEVDIATGAVTFEWHSLGSGAFPITDSYVPLNNSPLDYFHLNSVAYDTDGNFLFSARQVSVVAKLNSSTGAVLWRMGGKRSQITFTDGDGGPSWSHDVRRLPDGTISVFDNGNGRNPPYSRGVAWAVDETNLTAHVAAQWRHNPDLYAAYTGSDRQLPNGNQLIDWGNTGRTTEYASGQPVFEAQYTSGDWSYRTLRADWHATPARPPDMAVDRSATTATGYASWNGATDVATWQLWGGPDFQHLRQLGSAPRSGFETTVSGAIQNTDRVFQVRAINSSGQTIGVSGTTPDPIQAKYQSLGGPASFLGSPVGGEQSVAGGLEQDYSFGAILWSSSTGAWSMHGAIYAHYKQLGGATSVLGFPVTDETGTPDGVGRFNHFSGPPGWGGSIYWTPSTGAHEVHGAIRARWASMGWERSCLGYPVSDEFGIPSGRQSNFQRGFISWNASTGQTFSSC